LHKSCNYSIIYGIKTSIHTANMKAQHQCITHDSQLALWLTVSPHSIQPPHAAASLVYSFCCSPWVCDGLWETNIWWTYSVHGNWCHSGDRGHYVSPVQAWLPVCSVAVHAHFAVSDLRMFVGVYFALLYVEPLFVQQNKFELEFRFYKCSSNFRKKQIEHAYCCVTVSFSSAQATHFWCAACVVSCVLSCHLISGAAEFWPAAENPPKKMQPPKTSPNFWTSFSRQINPAKIRLSRPILEMYKLTQLHLSSSAASDHVECMFSTVGLDYWRSNLSAKKLCFVHDNYKLLFWQWHQYWLIITAAICVIITLHS